MMVAMYKSMPDLRITIEDMIAEGDKVACRNIWRWTDPPSGKKMQHHGADTEDESAGPFAQAMLSKPSWASAGQVSKFRNHSRLFK